MKQAKVEEHGTIDALRQLVSVQLTRSLVALAILAIAALVAFNLWLEIYKHAHIFFWANVVVYAIMLVVFLRVGWFLYFDGMFLSLFPLYYGVNFFLGNYFSISVIEEVQLVLDKMFLLCFASWLLVLFGLIVRPKIGLGVMTAKTIGLKTFLAVGKKIHLVSFLIALCVAMFFFLQISHVPVSAFLTSDRLELVSSVSQSGWYLKYLIIGYAWYVFLLLLSTKNTRRVVLMGLLLPVVIYWFSLVVVGSRREILLSMLPIFIFIFLVNDRKASLGQIASIIGALSCLLLFGAMRATTQESDTAALTNLFGEFLFPIATLGYYLDHVEQFELGSTFLQFFYNFIPKEVLPDKPLPLAVEFAYEIADPAAEHIMGYAYTPMTEVFLNFGYGGILAMPLLVCGFAMLLEIVSRGSPIILLPVLGQSIGFQRSDFSSFMFECVLLVIAFLLFTLLPSITRICLSRALGANVNFKN